MKTVPVDEIRQDAKSYLSIDDAELDKRIASCRSMRSEHWDVLNPTSPADIDKYYSQGTMIIENLVDFNTWGHHVHFPDPEKFGKRVLDFGCGLAYTAEAMAGNGKEITIADVPNPAFTFAKARLEKKGIPFEAVQLTGGMLPFRGTDKQFDAIFCIDVIEHIVNPVEMIWHFYTHLSTGGLLYITNLEAEDDGVHKQHIIYQPPMTSKFMELMGFEQVEQFLWKKK